MNELMYVQCHLQKGNIHTVGWIPVKKANAGTQIELKGLDGLWNVMSKGATMSADYLNERANDYRYTRKASDI